MDYTQPAACLDALRKLHPIDFRATHDTLSRIVRGLLGARPAPNQHLEVLEAARDTLNFAQGEMARAYTARPLPPSRDAERMLEHVVGLWQAMARSYAAPACGARCTRAIRMRFETDSPACALPTPSTKSGARRVRTRPMSPFC